MTRKTGLQTREPTLITNIHFVTFIFKGLYFLKMDPILDGSVDNFSERIKQLYIFLISGHYLNFNAKPKIQILNKI